MNPEPAMTIRRALQARGVALNQPADRQHIHELQKTLGISLDIFFRNLFGEFDGFKSYDERSVIDLWPIQRMIRETHLAKSIDGKQYHPIGDLLIDSDFVMCCLERQSEPVFLLFDGWKMASTAEEFFERLTSGALDPVSPRSSHK
jgi:hypothetical protein